MNRFRHRFAFPWRKMWPVALSVLLVLAFVTPSIADETDDYREAVKELCSILPREVTVLAVVQDAGEFPGMFDSEDDLLEEFAQWLALLFPQTLPIGGVRGDAATIARSATETLNAMAGRTAPVIPKVAQSHGVAVAAILNTPPEFLILVQAEHPAMALQGACKRNKLMVTMPNPLPEPDTVVQGDIPLSPDPIRDGSPLSFDRLHFKCLPGVLAVASDPSLLGEVSNRHALLLKSPSTLDAMSTTFTNSTFYTRAAEFLDPDEGLFWAIDLKTTVAAAGSSSAADFDSLEWAGLNDAALFCVGLSRNGDRMVLSGVLDFDRDLKAPWGEIGKPDTLEHCGLFLGRSGSFAALQIPNATRLFDYWESVLLEHAYSRDSTNLQVERSSAEKSLGFELRDSLVPLLGGKIYVHWAHETSGDWMVAFESPDPLRLERMIHDAMKNNKSTISEEPCGENVVRTASWETGGVCSWVMVDRLMIAGSSKGDVMDVVLDLGDKGNAPDLPEYYLEAAEQPASVVVAGDARDWIDGMWAWLDHDGDTFPGIRGLFTSGRPLPLVVQIERSNRRLTARATIDGIGGK